MGSPPDVGAPSAHTGSSGTSRVLDVANVLPAGAGTPCADSHLFRCVIPNPPMDREVAVRQN